MAEGKLPSVEEEMRSESPDECGSCTSDSESDSPKETHDVHLSLIPDPQDDSMDCAMGFHPSFGFPNSLYLPNDVNNASIPLSKIKTVEEIKSYLMKEMNKCRKTYERSSPPKKVHKKATATSTSKDTGMNTLSSSLELSDDLNYPLLRSALQPPASPPFENSSAEDNVMPLEKVPGLYSVSSASQDSQVGATVHSPTMLLRKILRQQLALFLHSQECSLKEKKDQDECKVLACAASKDVLSHLKNCNAGIYCHIMLCAASKRLIKHWKLCVDSECLMCYPITQCGLIANIESRGQFDDIDTETVDLEITSLTSYESKRLLQVINGNATDTSDDDIDDPQEPIQSSAAQPSASTSSGTYERSHSSVQLSEDEVQQMRSVLNVLYHTHRCLLREQKTQGQAKPCPLPRCIILRSILTHMKVCRAGEFCHKPQCAILWKIVSHWRYCGTSGCRMCASSKRAEAICYQYFEYAVSTSNTQCAVSSTNTQCAVSSTSNTQSADSSSFTPQNADSRSSNVQFAASSSSKTQYADSSTSLKQCADSSVPDVQNAQTSATAQASSFNAQKARSSSRTKKKARSSNKFSLPLTMATPVQISQPTSLLSHSARLSGEPRISPLPVNADSIVSNSGGFEPRRKLRKQIQKQLILLIHAQDCHLVPGECRIQHCNLMKNVLRHIQTCSEGHDCSSAHCGSSKSMLFHWEHCQHPQCTVCYAVRKYFGK